MSCSSCAVARLKQDLRDASVFYDRLLEEAGWGRRRRRRRRRAAAGAANDGWPPPPPTAAVQGLLRDHLTPHTAAKCTAAEKAPETELVPTMGLK